MAYESSFSTNDQYFTQSIKDFTEVHNKNIRLLAVPFDIQIGNDDFSQFKSAINTIILEQQYYFTQSQIRNQNRQQQKVIVKCQSSEQCPYEIQFKYGGQCYSNNFDNQLSEFQQDSLYNLIICSSNNEIHFCFKNHDIYDNNFDDLLLVDNHISSRFKLKVIQESEAKKLIKKSQVERIVQINDGKNIYKISQKKLPDLQQIILQSCRNNFIIQHSDFHQKALSYIKKLQIQDKLNNKGYLFTLFIHGYLTLAQNIFNYDYDIAKLDNARQQKISMIFNFKKSYIPYFQDVTQLRISIEIIDQNIFYDIENLYFPLFLSFLKYITDSNIIKLVRQTECQLDKQLLHLKNRKIPVNHDFQKFKQQPCYDQHQNAFIRQNIDPVEQEVIDSIQSLELDEQLTSKQILEQKMKEADSIKEEMTQHQQKRDELEQIKIKLLADINIVDKQYKELSLQLDHKLRVCSKIDDIRQKYLISVENQGLRAHRNELLKIKKTLLFQGQTPLQQPEFISTNYFMKISQEQKQNENEYMNDEEQKEYHNENSQQQQQFLGENVNEFQQNQENLNNLQQNDNLLPNEENHIKKQRKPASISVLQWQSIINQQQAVEKELFKRKVEKLQTEISNK